LKLKTGSDETDVTSAGRPFHALASATGKNNDEKQKKQYCMLTMESAAECRWTLGDAYERLKSREKPSCQQQD